jgi:hypothetical protein
MIEDRSVAAEVSDKLLAANHFIVDALKVVEQHCSKEEAEMFRVEAANVAGHLFAFLLRPLWQLHPDLAPEGLDMTASKKKKKP